MVRLQRRCGALAALTWLLAACAAPAAPAAAPAAPPAAAVASPTGAALAAPPVPIKVRQGLVGSLGDGPILIALDRGYFAEVGLDVEDNRFDAATRMMQPLAAGQLDVVSAALTAGLFNAFARDIDVRVVGDRGVESKGHGYNAIVARQDLWESGAIRSLADLRGRKVGAAGYQAGSLIALQLGMALEAQGMRLDDLDLVDITLPDTNAALANHTLDGAVQIEPLVALGLANNLFTVLMRSDEMSPDLQSALILYAAGFARDQRDAGRRWMTAYLRGVRDYVDAFTRDRGRDAVVESLARQTTVKDPNVYRMIVPSYMNPNGYVNVETLVGAQDWFGSHGYIPQKVDIPALVDRQFADYAVSVLGEYR